MFIIIIIYLFTYLCLLIYVYIFFAVLFFLLMFYSTLTLAGRQVFIRDEPEEQLRQAVQDGREGLHQPRVDEEPNELLQAGPETASERKHHGRVGQRVERCCGVVARKV